MKKAFRQMIQHDASGGIILVVAAVLALVFANSSLQAFYQNFLNLPVTIQIGAFQIAKPLVLWVNDGLMAIFFFLVGLEIKRETLVGQLSSPQQMILPIVACLAGIVFPALVYFWFNGGDPVAIRGWAIPTATDIAFALGIFSLFGRSLPAALKLFLLSVAIMDDIGAVIIIALFYSHDLSTLSLAIAFIGLLVLLMMNHFSIRKQGAYILVGMIVWAAVLKSGVHATLAGFAVAWFIPLKTRDEEGYSMLRHLEHVLQPWVAFLILPVFAFANAGVYLLDASIADFLNPVTLGIVFGLFVGKQFGIFGACWLIVKLKLAKLPAGTSWTQMYGTAVLCGIGFTMSLFIGLLAFEHQGLDYQASVKVGVLMGSIISAIIGALVMRLSISRSRLSL